MAKPHIEKTKKTLIEDKSDRLLAANKQVIHDIDLFYEIEPAEVLYVLNKVSDLERFQLLVGDENLPDKSLLNGCVVRKVYTEINQEILELKGDELRQFISLPLDSNYIKLPVKGELLPIIHFLDSGSIGNIKQKNSFYMNGINSWNSTHHNALLNISKPGVLGGASSDNIQQPEDGNPFVVGEQLPDLGENFTERSDIKKSQVYEGDVLYEGRFGQHIRLGSSDVVVDENPNWWSNGSEETLGKPVTIISNGQSAENTGELEPRDLYSSDFNKDSSTIILTENQPSVLDISYLDLDDEDAILKTLGFDLLTDTQNSTIQMNSGTILLNARDNKLLGFAKQGIGLITTGDMSIDVTNNWSTVSDSKDEEMGTSYKMTTPKADFVATQSTLGEDGDRYSMVFGEELVTILGEIMDAVGQQIFVGGGGPHAVQAANPGQLQFNMIKQKMSRLILSKKHKLGD